MDDWVILCKTRHQLRDVVRLMNQSLNEVKQTKHPYKTWIGLLKASGFDFLGYRITPSKGQQVTLAWKTIANQDSAMSLPVGYVTTDPERLIMLESLLAKRVAGTIAEVSWDKRGKKRLIHC
ncbi:hypothetical protein BIT28_23385 [Photobacterium proteolyticum]|uniref:Reverse transcriptase domain-containing protein n=1 Tax=Photobacterium proteolyticum TaxID=1903952 RepID=A0A1Q9GMH3_9GAMM|nr:hypothetical protein [Photobacterium proteolyticum]OLQ75712.1 hypothetical protein BIT28_23385 [Photobacterium proteolyticum]